MTMWQSNTDANLYGGCMAHRKNRGKFGLWYLKDKSNPTEVINVFGIAMNTKNVGQFRREERVMSCKSCQSENRHKFSAEIAIHFPGLKGLSKPIVWIFPKLLSCLSCGLTEFEIPGTELRQLRESAPD